MLFSSLDSIMSSDEGSPSSDVFTTLPSSSKTTSSSSNLETLATEAIVSSSLNLIILTP